MWIIFKAVVFVIAAIGLFTGVKLNDKVVISLSAGTLALITPTFYVI